MNKARLSISLIVSILFSSFGFAQDSSLNLQSYAANFKMAENQYIKKLSVSVKDNKLVATSDASPNEFVELAPSGTKDLFKTKIQSYDAEFLFTRTEGGVNAVKISIAGGQVVLSGNKEVRSDGGIGRHAGLKILCLYGRAGSSPAPSTKTLS